MRTICGTILAAAMAALSAHGAFDVRDFGAKGDGVTDDTTAFQSAIHAVVAQGAGKIIIPYSPKGYRIAGSGHEFVDGKPCRGQLVIPPVPGLNIVFEGEMPCKLLYSYQVRPPESVKSNFTPTRFGTMKMPNTCLFSDWTPPTTRPRISGARSTAPAAIYPESDCTSLVKDSERMWGLKGQSLSTQ